MLVVIFRSEIKQFDDEYHVMARQLRDLAISDFGCLNFISVAEGKTEISLSYWNTEQQITAWKKQAQHLIAQQRGKTDWYQHYSIQVAQIIRDYESNETTE